MHIERSVNRRWTPDLRVVTPPRLLGVEHIGDWRLEAEISNTGIATVRAASREADADQRVVIKAYSGESYPRARFDSEVAIHRMLSHPHIVKFVDAGVLSMRDGASSETVLYVVTEKASNGSVLNDIDSRNEAYDTQRAADVTGQIAEALTYVHKNGIVHADIKPDNVLIKNDTTYVLADFGLAGKAPLHEESKVMPGAIPYLAPEQFFRYTLQESDTYALALTCFYMLTGERFWEVELDNRIKMAQSEKSHAAFVNDRLGLVSHPMQDPLHLALAYLPNQRLRIDKFATAMRRV